jgi:hypothetical protein
MPSGKIHEAIESQEKKGMKTVLRNVWWQCALRGRGLLWSTILAVILAATLANADEPLARSKDYHMQHSKNVLKFDD